MNISDREELSKQIFKNTKLENEVNDLKEKLMAEKIRNKSELAMNDDLKRIIENSPPITQPTICANGTPFSRITCRAR